MNKFKMTNEEKKVKDKEYWDAWFTVYKVRSVLRKFDRTKELPTLVFGNRIKGWYVNSVFT